MKSVPWSCRVIAVLVSFAFMATAGAAPPAGVRCVQPDGVDITNLGTNWGPTHAWQTLEYALDQVNNQEDDAITEIWIAIGGTGHKYKPHETDNEVSWLVYKPVVIRGGFAGQDDPANRTAGAVSTLSGDLGEDVHSNQIMQVDLQIKGAGTVLLDRLRFEDSGDPEHPVANVKGAAIFADFTNTLEGVVALLDCEFAGNTSSEEGGAVYARQCALDARHCAFDGNKSLGRPSTSMLQGGPSDGGAISYGGPLLLLARCTFQGNQALNENHAQVHSGGGAIYIYSTTEEAKLVNCTFLDNSAWPGSGTEGIGGAVSEAKVHDAPRTDVVNCLFAGNFAGDTGGGIYSLGRIHVSDCTFSQNVATSLGGGLAVSGLGTDDTVVQNCILWNNTADDLTDFDAQFHPLTGGGYTIQRSCVQGLSSSSNNNIHVDPSFRGPGAGDFHLLGCSPAIDVGDADFLPFDFADLNHVDGDSDPHPYDLDGYYGAASARVKGSGLDMGAYEHAEVVHTDCPADLNGDHNVDGGDLGLLLGSWGPCDCQADLNCDGNVDGGDLGLLLGSWGNCPGYSMMMSGGGSALDDLMAYLGVETDEELVAALTALSFEDMTELLESFLGS